MSGEQVPIYFVYLCGQKSCRPQKWYGDQTDGHGRFRHGTLGHGDLLFLKQLNDHEAPLPLNDLVEKYPAPSMGERVPA